MRLDAGLAGIADLVRHANKYLEKKQPWMLARQADKAPLGTVLYHGAEVLRLVARALAPVMPGKMADLVGALGLSENPEVGEWQKWGLLKPGVRVGEMTCLFPRISAATQKNKEGGKPMVDGTAAKVPEPPTTVAEVEIADFLKIHLRTAKVVSAAKIEGTDKLLCLQVDLGGEKRQIVAGIARSYTPDQLVGKTVVVVANLKRAKIRGVESAGMLLAASSCEDLKVLTVDGDIAGGCEVR
jgi:methionyl-tRNA synthetase